MVRGKAGRAARVAIAATVAASAYSVCMVAAGSAATESATLELIAPVPAVTVERAPGQPRVILDLGTYLAARRGAFEIRLTRDSYEDPVVARQAVRERDRIRFRTLDPGVARDFWGFADFFHLTLTDAAGARVLTSDQDFCPNGETVRLGPDSPDTSPYPPSCPQNPFVLGSVWGVQAGWATSTTDPFGPVNTASLPDGDYTATLSVKPFYRNVFGISASTATVRVTLRTGAPPRHATPSPPATPARRPADPPAVPRWQRPDLVALPAWAIGVLGDNPGTPAVEPERLTFAADVWNAGPSPLVIEGFRRANEPVMDSYQYFYDGTGRRIGHAGVGSMEWDARAGHHHWHFRDFAGYRLLDAGRREVTRSQKEAFCLANTDAINLFVPGAVWQPDNTDLHSACGEEDSLTVRQALATGHGDTYPNSAPGRALDIANLPNGTYYIEVTANPDHSLYETDLANNTALRQVILGGTPGHRTVLVPPYGLIDTDPPDQ